MVGRACITFWRKLGPGLTAGAADDDPSGIATYSQAGAAFGFGFLWTILLSTPLMVAVQAASARIGLATGRGLAAAIGSVFGTPLLLGLVALLLGANILNIAADLAAMGDALHLVIGGPANGFSLVFAAVSVLLQIFVPYARYSAALKLMTAFLFAYVAVAFVVHVPWRDALHATLAPAIRPSRDWALMMVAILGTTISPYMFFWQSSQEAENVALNAAAGAATDLGASRISIDTWVGMVISNLVAYFIILSCAVTLHAKGITNIETAAQAAEALRPLAGPVAFALFACGIIGTGLLAIPVLAGSAAYALADALNWKVGLAKTLGEAKAFYGVLVAAAAAGAAIDFMPVDPVRMLFWSAVINGLAAVPILVAVMIVGANRKIMGHLAAGRLLRLSGWMTVIVMASAAVKLVVSAVSSSA